MNVIFPQDHETKAEQTREALMALIRARGPGLKLPTMQEMCVQFAVSRTTLEQAMRALEQRGLLRRRHGSGIYVSERLCRKSVGVVFGGDIFSSGFSPFWGLLLQAVRAQAGGHDMLPLAYLDISEGQAGLGGHSQLIEDLEAQRLDGLLLFSPHFADDEAGQLRAHGVPVVVFGGTGQDWAVTHDFDRFIRLAARELAMRGCRRLALLGHGVLSRRLLLRDALRDAGAAEIEIADWSYDTWAPIIPEAGSHEHCTYRLTQHMLANAAQTPLPDTLVSTDDTSTRGAITALQQAGLHPGRDFRIVTSVNTGSPLLTPYADAMTCIAFDPAESVRAALEMLSTLMDGGTPPRNPVLIAPTVVMRATDPIVQSLPTLPVQ